MFITMEEKAEIQKILFLYRPDNIVICNGFVLLLEFLLLFLIDPLALLYILQSVFHSWRNRSQLINMFCLPFGQTLYIFLIASQIEEAKPGSVLSHIP